MNYKKKHDGKQKRRNRWSVGPWSSKWYQKDTQGWRGCFCKFWAWTTWNKHHQQIMFLQIFQILPWIWPKTGRIPVQAAGPHIWSTMNTRWEGKTPNGNSDREPWNRTKNRKPNRKERSGRDLLLGGNYSSLKQRTMVFRDHGNPECAAKFGFVWISFAIVCVVFSFLSGFPSPEFGNISAPALRICLV